MLIHKKVTIDTLDLHFILIFRVKKLRRVRLILAIQNAVEITVKTKEDRFSRG